MLRKTNYIQRKLDEKRLARHIYTHKKNTKRSGDLLKWIHNNGAMNISVVIMYFIVDSVINAFSLSLRPFDPKRNVSTIVVFIFPCH